MRKVIDMQMKIGELAIENIEFDPRSRDESPELLMGLQSIYLNREVRDRASEVLLDIVGMVGNTWRPAIPGRQRPSPTSYS